MFRKKKYLDWKTYKNRIDFLDVFYWQQEVRKENLKGIIF